MSADLALVNGNIITMDTSNPRAEAIAVKGEIIIKVGTNSEIAQLIDNTTKVIQLKGKTVVPGFIDTHIHVADLGRLLMWLNLTGSKSIKDMQNMLREKIIQTPPGKWILGRGWNEKFFKKGCFPNRFDLDVVAPDNPVVFYNQSGKLCLVNSKALEFAKIVQETSKLSTEGIVEKDPITGTPTGILKGKAMDNLWSTISEPMEKELLELTNLACSKILEAGITSVHWMVLSPLEFSIIKKLEHNGVPLRIYVVIPFEIWKKDPEFFLASGHQKNSLEIGALEISVDGYLANKTAALFSPYRDGSESTGKLLYTQECLSSCIFEVIQSGFQLIIHAMGDKAIEAALIAVEKVMNKTNNQDTRVRFEQAALINKSLLKRLKNQKIIVSVQPCVINSEFKTWSAIDNLGQSRARWLFPLRTLIDNDIVLIGGSDCPMEPLNPLLGIQTVVNRLFFPKEGIDVAEGMAMYTIDAAYSTKEENYKGSIKEGMLSDLTIISKDPTIISSENIGKVEVKATIIGGKIVYCE
jgi:predicted amidohydrolase YtcJ